MVEREEEGTKCFFFRLGVVTQKIPIILKKINFTALMTRKVVYDPAYIIIYSFMEWKSNVIIFGW